MKTWRASDRAARTGDAGPVHIACEENNCAGVAGGCPDRVNVDRVRASMLVTLVGTVGYDDTELR
jgi:hypothetical protein